MADVMMMVMVMAFSTLAADVDAYVQGKTWYWYVPLWLLGAYIFVGLLGFNPNEQMPFLISIAHAFDFFLHEMAHILTGFLPAVMTAAAGSFSELLLGTLLLVMAYKQRSYFALLIASLWFMLACQSAGAYMADAQEQKMQLVSLGGALAGSDQAIHDWSFVFSQLHILGFGSLIGTSVRIVGAIVGLMGLAFTGWLIYKMATSKGAARA
jgi:hypothetical protein